MGGWSKPVARLQCTAGNSSSENDGAAAFVLTNPEEAQEWGVAVMAYLRSFAIADADPILTYPSVPMSVNKALQKTGLMINEIDLVEIQEAFFFHPFLLFNPGYPEFSYFFSFNLLIYCWLYRVKHSRELLGHSPSEFYL
jgi:hypothetical protein